MGLYRDKSSGHGPAAIQAKIGRALHDCCHFCPWQHGRHRQMVDRYCSPDPDRILALRRILDHGAMAGRTHASRLCRAANKAADRACRTRLLCCRRADGLLSGDQPHPAADRDEHRRCLSDLRHAARCHLPARTAAPRRMARGARGFHRHAAGGTAGGRREQRARHSRRPHVRCALVLRAIVRAAPQHDRKQPHHSVLLCRRRRDQFSCHIVRDCHAGRDSGDGQSVSGKL